MTADRWTDEEDVNPKIYRYEVSVRRYSSKKKTRNGNERKGLGRLRS